MGCDDHTFMKSIKLYYIYEGLAASRARADLPTSEHPLKETSSEHKVNELP